MRRVAAIVALALTGCWDAGGGRAGTAAAGEMAEPIETVSEAPDSCALSIRFGSYAMGIDHAAARQIEALVSADGGVSHATRHPRGREGEYTLCVQTRSPAQAASLFDRVRPLLPADPRGPIEVLLGDGRRYRAPAR